MKFAILVLGLTNEISLVVVNTSDVCFTVHLTIFSEQGLGLDENSLPGFCSSFIKFLKSPSYYMHTTWN